MSDWSAAGPWKGAGSLMQPGSTPQMSLAYSEIVLSELNFPLLAMLHRAIFVHLGVSCNSYVQNTDNSTYCNGAARGEEGRGAAAVGVGSAPRSLPERGLGRSPNEVGGAAPSGVWGRSPQPASYIRAAKLPRGLRWSPNSMRTVHDSIKPAGLVRR